VRAALGSARSGSDLRISTTNLAMERDVTRELDANLRHGEQCPKRDSAHWPVLARLPRITSEPAHAAPRSPAFAMPDQGFDESALQLDATAQDRNRRPPLYVVDPAHTNFGVGGAESAPAMQSRAGGAMRGFGALEAAPVGSPAASRPATRYRIDPPSTQRPAGRKPPTPAEPMSFASRVFRLHETLAPHMGLVGAAALVICGGMLYWLAIGRTGSTIDPSELLEFSNGWSQDAPEQPVVPAEQATPDAVSKQPPFEQQSSPRVADAAAAAPSATGAGSESGPATSTPAVGNEGPALAPPRVPASSNAPPLGDESSATTRSDQGVTPTPETAIFPATPYPTYAFDYQLTAPAGSPVPAIADRPIDVSTGFVSPR